MANLSHLFVMAETAPGVSAEPWGYNVMHPVLVMSNTSRSNVSPAALDM
jgi:hypothetical protein